MGLYLVLSVVALVLVSALLADRMWEQRRLRRFVQGLQLRSVDQRQRSLEVAGLLHGYPAAASGRDPPYLTSLFGALGPTPYDVITKGGCCSGRSRLYIVCLAELGVRAH
jgi:hypothetical protein